MTQTWHEPVRRLLFAFGLLALVYVALNDNYWDRPWVPAQVRAPAWASAQVPER
jgi:hypothetical protein